MIRVRTRLPPPARRLRVIGFDDAPFPRRRGAHVSVSGVVCAGTRFEGLVFSQGGLRKDGWGATDTLVALLTGSKFLPQLHLVLLDGIAFGGLNLVDLPRLHEALGVPCVAVMRRQPDLVAMRAAIAHLPGAARRLQLLDRAGEIHVRPPFVFQVCGLPPEETHGALLRVTDTGHVPEALRLAHLIGAALRTGQSSGRA